MNQTIPEKAQLLAKLKEGGFNVPDFLYVPAQVFEEKVFDDLDAFLQSHRESFKVIARSAHPMESHYTGGTFDSLETYADVGGIQYARNRIMKLAKTTNRLSIQRQQTFNHAPVIDMDEMGIIVMPFINGSNVMAKMVWEDWEFGYCRDRIHKVHSEPYITKTPHDIRLLQLSEKIQLHLGFRCEIEYIISSSGDIHVVQAKDISEIETLEEKENARAVILDGVHRIRKRRSYRERPLYVMNNRAFYINIISKCEDLVDECQGSKPGIEGIIQAITDYEEELDSFALRHQRFAVLGLSIREPEELYQIANHYLDDTPELQAKLSKALHNNLYKIDIFLSEADTLISKDKLRVNLCSHDAYGIDTVRNPMWSVYWSVDKHDAFVKEFTRLGYKTGDTIGIDIDANDRPTVYRH